MNTSPPFVVEVAGGPASLLHRESADVLHGELPEMGGAGVGRLIRFLHPEAPAVVLGSGQPENHVDQGRAAAGGVAIVRRRSGGSAVLVDPAEILWVDVTIPCDDPLWRADVGRAGWWLGACWAAALGDIGVADAQVWTGAMIRSPWSSRICFAGLGPGEVTVGAAKIVGISQRRTRRGVLFQCAVPLEVTGRSGLGAWDPGGLLDVLALTPLKRQQGAVDLAGVAATVGNGPALSRAFINRCGQACPVEPATPAASEGSKVPRMRRWVP